MSQGGFGFSGEALPAKRPSKVVRLARCGMFWMWDHGFGWAPYKPATMSPDEVKQSAARDLRRSVVRIVPESEVGR